MDNIKFKQKGEEAPSQVNHTDSAQPTEQQATQEQPAPLTPEQARQRAELQHVGQIGFNLCNTAMGLVAGERQVAYDHPARDFARTAKVWSGILGVEVSPEQVGLCMVGLKLVREAHSHKADNLVDAIGYVICTEATRDAWEKTRAAMLAQQTKNQVPNGEPSKG